MNEVKKRSPYSHVTRAFNPMKYNSHGQKHVSELPACCDSGIIPNRNYNSANIRLNYICRDQLLSRGASDNR